MTTVTTVTAAAREPVGELLRQWRERRRISQLELSLAADVSTRHLSFVETGRSSPSRHLLMRLGEHLDLPLRERNRLLLAAGYAPVYPHSPLDGGELAAARDAVRRLLAAHEPYPAVVIDRSWHLVDGNDGIGLLVEAVAAELLEPPVNVLRVTLHPDGMAPHIANLGQWRAHVLGRLRREVAATADPGLAGLLEELRGYPCADPEPEIEVPGPGDVVLPLRLRRDGRELSFFSTVATFGTPLDVTLSELSIEAFYPADAATADALSAR
ncbi:helix-turn-helix domain-containing protein [Prauserella oleivorans]|uniref:Helix-turn-helix domain-containing protein n=1 Tax=Prauserella oleivorans TaxID=1478153 RepID=A0ABW5WC01_9PSEU